MNSDLSEKKHDRKLAEEMSEGNVYLKNALITMWENNIEVLDCSIGNKEDGIYPYITIVVDSNSVDLVNNIYDETFKYMKQNVQINFVNDFLDNGKYRFIVNISAKNEYGNVLFGLIMKTIFDSKGKEFVQNDIVASTVHLMNLFGMGKCIFRLAVSQNVMYITVGDEETHYSDGCLNLKDLIPTVREKRTIDYGVYKCDKESLMSLASIMYEAAKGFQKKKDKK